MYYNLVISLINISSITITSHYTNPHSSITIVTAMLDWQSCKFHKNLSSCSAFDL